MPRKPGHDISSSFTDLMTSVAILFLFLAVAMIVVTVLKDRIAKKGPDKVSDLAQRVVEILGDGKQRYRKGCTRPSNCSLVVEELNTLRVVFPDLSDDAQGSCVGLTFDSGSHVLSEKS